MTLEVKRFKEYMNLETVRKRFSKIAGVCFVTTDGVGGFIVYIDADAICPLVETTAARFPVTITISTVSDGD